MTNTTTIALTTMTMTTAADRLWLAAEQTLALAATAALLVALLTWRRRTLFGAPLAPDARRSAAARTLIARYRATILAGTLAAVALSWAAVVDGVHLPLVVAAPFVQVASLVAAYLLAFRGARALAAAQAGSTPLDAGVGAPPPTARSASLAPGTAPPPGELAGQIGPYIVLLAAAAAIHRHLPGATFAAFAPLVIAFATCAIVSLSTLAILYGTPRPTSGGGDRNRRLSLLATTATGWLVAVSASAIALLPLIDDARIGHGLTIAVSFLPTTLLLVIVALVHRGTRENAAASALDASEPVDRTRADKWRCGMFYVNRDDPALLVAERFGLGYTLNFGRPLSWVLLAVLVVVPLVVVVVIRRFAS